MLRRIPNRRRRSAQEVLRRAGEWIVAHPVAVLAAWLAAVVLATPWALRLDDVLSEQGASKIVPGTSSAQVAERLEKAFPNHSERETAIVLTAEDVRALPARRLQAVIDASMEPLLAQGKVISTTSSFTLRRDAVLVVLNELDRQVGLSTAGVSPAVRQARLDAAVAAGAVPPPFVALARQAVTAPPAMWPKLAGDFTVTADWGAFPIAIDDSPLVSADASTALVSIGYSPRGPDPDLAELREKVRELVEGLGQSGSIRASVTGELALVQDTYDRAEADNALMEQVAYAIIVVVLLLFFRAVLPAILTVAMIGLAMNVSQAWLYLVGDRVPLTQFTATIMTFVMLGAGVDYSMLLSSRYRQERVAGHPPREALVRAFTHAGESIALAGTAVVIAFSATLLAPVDWIPPLGYGGLVGVPVILLAALTITPALIALLGDRFFWLGWRPLTDLESRGGLARHLRAMAGVSRRAPKTVVLAFLVATVPFVAIVCTHTLTADPVALSPDTDARTGYQSVAKHWGAGTLLPTVVVGTLDKGTLDEGTLDEGTPSASALARLAQVSTDLAGVDGVERVLSATQPAGMPLTPAEQAELPADVVRDYIAPDGTTRIVVVLGGEPLSAQGRASLEQVESVIARSDLPDLQVGGATLVDKQYDEQLRSSFWIMVTLVSGGIFLLLLFSLRSLAVPIRLILTIFMSNVWAVGITFGIFAMWLGDAVINDLPVFLVILMMGLGMDYEIFLMTRVRDLVKSGMDDAEAAGQAVVDTGRVITAAGLVMAGSLGTMALSSTLMLRQYGVGLGTAVLLDSTAIRMLLVPASLLLLRRYNWWLPRWAGEGLRVQSRPAGEPVTAP